MQREHIWAQLICPVPITAMIELGEIAPPGACIRAGGQTFHEGAFHEVIEVVVPGAAQESLQPEATDEASAE